MKLPVRAPGRRQRTTPQPVCYDTVTADSPRPQTPSSLTDTDSEFSDLGRGEADQAAEGPSASQSTRSGHQPRGHSNGRSGFRERAQAREQAHRLGDVNGILAEVAVWTDTDELDDTPDSSQQLGPEGLRSVQLWAQRRDGTVTRI